MPVTASVVSVSRDRASPQPGGSEGAGVALNRSAVTVVLSDAWLLIIDPQGKRTGLDPDSGREVREIPASVVFVDQIDNAVTGEPATSYTVQVIINRPPDGAYRVIVVGQGKPTELGVHAYATDGSRQPLVRVPLSLGNKSRNEFRLHLSSAPGSGPRVEATKTGGRE